MQIVRAAALGVLFSLLAVPDARAGYEIVPFGGLTRIEEGDAACRDESQGTATGLQVGYSGVTFALGGRFTFLQSKGGCDTRLNGTLLGIYAQGPLWTGEKDAIAIGGELLVSSTGRLNHPLIARADVVGSTGFAGELVYLRALSQEGSIKKGQETFPRLIVVLQARAGYRLSSVTAQDAAFNDVDYSWNGPYAVLGIQLYLNPTD